jgi:quercetin dioxygenase-like cupin family protein
MSLKGQSNGQRDGRPNGLRTPPATNTAIFVGHFTMPRGATFTTHTHPVHQLAWSARGLLRVRSEQGSWLLPPIPLLIVAHAAARWHNAPPSTSC